MNKYAQKNNFSGTQEKRKKRALTRDYLLRATYSYLQRFATTEKNLREVLRRKAKRRLPEFNDDPEFENDTAALRLKAEEWIDEIIQKAVEQNLVNDRTFAEGRAASLIRGGNSKMKTAQKLMTKGVDADVVEDVIDRLESDYQDLDDLAAVKYARKRRFGPFSIRHDGTEVQEKELASMCRAGFSFHLAGRILKMPKDEAEKIIYGSSF